MAVVSGRPCFGYSSKKMNYRVFLNWLLRAAVIAGVLVFPTTAHAQGDEDHRFRIEFEFGPLNVRTLDFQAPSETGTFLSLEETEEVFTMTSQVTFEWMVQPRHEFNFYWAPLELRDFEVVPEVDIIFGGVTFPAGVETITRFLFYEYSFRYRYQLVRTDRFDVRLGATVSITDTIGTVLQESTELFEEVDDQQVLPLVHGYGEVFLTPQISVVFPGDWIRLSDSRFTNIYLVGRWHPRPRWDFSFGYRGMSRTVESLDLNNRFTFDNVIFTVGFRFGGPEERD